MVRLRYSLDFHHNPLIVDQARAGLELPSLYGKTIHRADIPAIITTSTLNNQLIAGLLGGLAIFLLILCLIPLLSLYSAPVIRAYDPITSFPSPSTYPLSAPSPSFKRKKNRNCNSTVLGKYPYGVGRKRSSSPPPHSQTQANPDFDHTRNIRRAVSINIFECLGHTRETEAQAQRGDGIDGYEWVDVEEGRFVFEEPRGRTRTRTCRCKGKDKDEKTPLVGKKDGKRGYGTHTRVLKLREESAVET